MPQTIDQQIAAAYKELIVRERAAAHLRDMAKILNATSINRLYDQLNHLHIARIEGGL